MVSFYSENNFSLGNEDDVALWIGSVINEEGFTLGEISYVFCDDEYLLRLNRKFLDHDTYTDIITFDYTLGKELHSEIYISTQRVMENADELDVQFVDELHRVIIHGILHLCGYADKSPEEELTMRKREDLALASRTFI